MQLRSKDTFEVHSATRLRSLDLCALGNPNHTGRAEKRKGKGYQRPVNVDFGSEETAERFEKNIKAMIALHMEDVRQHQVARQSMESPSYGPPDKGSIAAHRPFSIDDLDNLSAVDF
jgi:hypothetical protein